MAAPVVEAAVVVLPGAPVVELPGAPVVDDCDDGEVVEVVEVVELLEQPVKIRPVAATPAAKNDRTFIATTIRAGSMSYKCFDVIAHTDSGIWLTLLQHRRSRAQVGQSRRRPSWTSQPLPSGSLNEKNDP